MLLPLMFPLVLEFSLVNSASQCCAAQVYGADASQSFEITNCRILCDIVRCDAVILEELRKVLDAGNPLPIHIASYATSQHTLSLNTPARTAVYAPAAQSWSIQLSRAFTRIKTIFVTHESDESHGTTRTQCDTFTSWTGAAPWDNPNYTLEKYPVRSAEDYRFQLQLGARLWPDIPLSNHAEAHMRLGQVIGMNSTVIGHSILPGEWLQTSFIQAMDMEKGSANPSSGSGLVALTGADSRTPGDIVRLLWENVYPNTPVNEAGNPTDTGAWIQRNYVTLHYDAVIELRSEGVLVLE
jgi:hypothetical protein